jgi:hypothetical protein
MFSPTGPNTALIGSVLAETCCVIGTVDFVLMPKTPPIKDLCRTYRLCGHEASSLTLSLEETSRGVPLQVEEKKEMRGGRASYHTSAVLFTKTTLKVFMNQSFLKARNGESPLFGAILLPCSSRKVQQSQEW